MSVGSSVYGPSRRGGPDREPPYVRIVPVDTGKFEIAVTRGSVNYARRPSSLICAQAVWLVGMSLRIGDLYYG